MILKLIVCPNRFAGVYEIWRYNEPGCPPYFKVPELPVIDEYYCDVDGWVAKVLTMEKFTTKNGIDMQAMYTAFGKDIVYYATKKGYYKMRAIHLMRPRFSFASFGRGLRYPTLNDKVFIAKTIIGGMDPIEAYLSTYPNSKRGMSNFKNAKYRIHLLLNSERIMRWLSMILRDLAKERGITEPEFFIDKLVSSVSGPIKTPVQLEMLKILARAGSNEEVITLLEAGTAPSKSGVLPSPKSNMQLPVSSKVTEAEYTEVVEALQVTKRKDQHDTGSDGGCGQVLQEGG